MKRSLVVTVTLAMLLGIIMASVGMPVYANPQLPGQLNDAQELATYQLMASGYSGMAVGATLPRVVVCQQLADRQALADYHMLTSGYPNLVEATPMLIAMEAAVQ